MGNVLEFDVTPLSLGIRTTGNLSRKLIERNSVIPCQKSMVFTTASDLQTKMAINLLQGESQLANRNRHLGSFILDELPAAPRGAVQVKVSINIDANGVLNVSAYDLATGKGQKITVTAANGLNQIDIEKMQKEAQEHEQDPNDKQKITSLESARRLAYVTQYLEKDLPASMSPELVERLHAASAQLNLALEHQSEALNRVNYQLGRVLSEVFSNLETSSTQPKIKSARGSRGVTKVGEGNPLEDFYVLSVRQGGMGKVSFVLRDGRIFAVKELNDELIEDQQAVQRFITEARTWMDLERHTNIIFALLVREIGGKPFLFLEYADGGDLGQWVGKLPVAQALDYAIQFCTGMSYAYCKSGIVHRDIKPANVLLAKDNRFRYGYAAKVTDFGLAGIWKATVNDDLDINDTQMSRGMGTWPYMPPEQFSEKVQIHHGVTPRPVSVRSDVYSFGVLLYELFTGSLPFTSVQEIFSSTPEEPRRKHKDIPKELSELIKRCLAKSPDERYSSFEEILLELVHIYEQATGESYNMVSKSEELTHLDWVARGASQVALGNYEEGYRCYDKALEQVDAFSPAWQGKGLCMEFSGLFDEAIQCYDAAIQNNPYLEDALLGKARCLIQMKCFGEAVSFYERAYEAQLLTSIGSD
ncbi:MAG: Hsp70 family protein [Anaerolineales bacterium]|nr:Hsp70 family protein [Anaerolineales bacterium]